jgi:hypothetical protein
MVRGEFQIFLLKIFIFLQKLGNFIFNSLFNKNEPVSFASVTVLIIGIVHYFLPTDTINAFFFDIYSKNEVLAYEAAAAQFDKVK